MACLADTKPCWILDVLIPLFSSVWSKMRFSHVIDLLSVVSGISQVGVFLRVMRSRLASLLASGSKNFVLLHLGVRCNSRKQQFMLLRTEARLRLSKQIVLPLIEVWEDRANDRALPRRS